MSKARMSKARMKKVGSMPSLPVNEGLDLIPPPPPPSPVLMPGERRMLNKFMARARTLGEDFGSSLPEIWLRLWADSVTCV